MIKKDRNNSKRAIQKIIKILTNIKKNYKKGFIE